LGKLGRQLTTVTVLAALALASGPALSATKSKVKTPPSSRNRATLGTRQLSGENAQLGVTYTLGKASPINVTLDKVEYTLEPALFGTTAIWPKRGEKLMVLHYTLHNPNPRDFGLSWHTLEINAVDANDRNWRFVTNTAIEATHELCNMALKPAQKTKVYTAIIVPAQGQLPKLILQSPDRLVLRYDLRNKVTPLPAPIADPADPSGATALETVPAQVGAYYPMLGLHAKIDSLAFATGPVTGKAKKGACYLTIIGTAKNNLPGKCRFVWSTFAPKVTDADGGELRWNDEVYYASRPDRVSAELEPKQELRFRYVFEVPEGVQLKTLTLSQSSSHAYAYDLSQVQ
jgi:hypothetical protein